MEGAATSDPVARYGSCGEGSGSRTTSSTSGFPEQADTYEVPAFAHIPEGTLTVDYRTKGTRTCGAGATFMEPRNGSHVGRVERDPPVRLPVVHLGSETARNVVTRR